VRVEAVLPAHKHRDGEDVYWETTPVPDFRHGRFAVQMGAFAAIENARSLQQKLVELYAPVKITTSESGQGNLHRVVLGDFSDLIEAHLTAGQLESQGYPSAFVVAVEQHGDPVN
jgi:cell division septation protein DedD